MNTNDKFVAAWRGCRRLCWTGRATTIVLVHAARVCCRRLLNSKVCKKFADVRSLRKLFISWCRTGILGRRWGLVIAMFAKLWETRKRPPALNRGWIQSARISRIAWHAGLACWMLEHCCSRVGRLRRERPNSRILVV